MAISAATRTKLPLTKRANYAPVDSASILSLATCSAAYAVAAGTELTNSQATIAIW
jgi:hypothetical protein